MRVRAVAFVVAGAAGDRAGTTNEEQMAFDSTYRPEEVERVWRERWEATRAALRALGLSLFRRRAFVRLRREREAIVEEMRSLDALLAAE